MNHLIIVPTETEASMLAKKPSMGSHLCIRTCDTCSKDKCQDKVYLCISGIGRTCARTTQAMIEKEKITKVTLIGFAGNLTSENRLGHMYIIKTVTDKDDVISMKKPTEKDIDHINHNGYATLITTNKPVCTKERKMNLSNYADLVDMEGYHIAKLCDQKGVSLHMIRIVSDNCDTDLEPFFSKGPEQKELPPQILTAQKKLAETVNTIAKL
jgi:nucleoside phosphorylase